jgi:hypothetical protein
MIHYWLNHMRDKNKLAIAEWFPFIAITAGLLLSVTFNSFLYAIIPLAVYTFFGIKKRKELEKRIISLSAKATEQNPGISIDRIAGLEKSVSQHSQRMLDISNLLELSSKLNETKEIGSFESKINEFDINLKDVYGLLDKYSKSKSYNEVGVSDDQVDKRINELVESKFELIKKILPRNYIYDFVRDREESHAKLIEALNDSRQRLIIVCPWLSEYVMTPSMKALFTKALQREVKIDIGWGHLGDVGDRKYLRKENLLPTSNRDKGQKLNTAVKWLSEQEMIFPNLKLKVLGTHEKILICDQKFIMIGSHNFMTSNIYSEERELGIWTNDPQKINEIIEEYDNIQPPEDSQAPPISVPEKPILRRKIR